MSRPDYLCRSTLGFPAEAVFCHHDFGAARTSGYNVKLIHKRAHQKNSAARRTQEILFGQRVWNTGESKTRAFIEDMDDHFLAGQVDSQVNLFFGTLLVAVVKRVNDALSDAHANFVAIVFAEAGGFRHAKTHFLSQIDAFDLRLQRDFEVLRVCAHALRSTGGKLRLKERTYR